MSVSNAWLLTFSDKLHAAVGNLEMIHLLPHIPELIEVPQTPAWCRYLVAWQNLRLPLMDIRLFLALNHHDNDNFSHQNKVMAGIVAYHPQNGNVQKYGVLLMSELPVRIVVDDQQWCDLPESPGGWTTLAISCFNHPEHGPVPILDLPRIFSDVSI
ncbi:MAG: hypothetical protein HY356_06125 [Gammaproteobacteria bacterium]|nr:hypothetical protein [Gammaproteobacteria bacterium]